MGEKYLECRKRQASLNGNMDGCQEFLRVGADDPHCCVCGCHMNYHRKVKVSNSNSRYVSKVVYTECHKNHSDHQTCVYNDGCKEFLPGPLTPLFCAACDCHKSFHKSHISVWERWEEEEEAAAA